MCDRHRFPAHLLSLHVALPLPDLAQLPTGLRPAEASGTSCAAVFGSFYCVFLLRLCRRCHVGLDGCIVVRDGVLHVIRAKAEYVANVAT